MSDSVKHPALMMATVMLTAVITAIDATIANVVLPHMQGSLAATQDQIAWVLTSYVVASAVCTPPTAWLAARFGQRRVLAGSVVGFLIASMLCGAATSLTQMVIFRVLQGAFGASMLPLGQAIVMNAFPREKHGKVLAIWSLGAMVGPICGPSLGGYIAEALNWRWVFYVNAPLCLVALAGVLLFIPESKREDHMRFDAFGFGLVSVALIAFQLMLDRGQSLNWFKSTEIILEACLAGVCLYLFIVHMLTAKRTPFIEPRLFTDRNFVLGLATVVLLHMMMMGQMALLPVYLQSLMHKPVDHVGLVMMPRGVAALIGTLLVSRLSGRVSNRWLMVTGFSMLGWSMYEMSTISLYVSDATIIAIGFVQGIGSGLALVPLTTAAYATLAPQLRTEGAAMYTLVRNLGSSVGISVLFARVAQLTQVHHQQIGEQITAFRPLPPLWDVSTASGAMLLDAELTRQAAGLGYLNCYLLMAGLMVIAIPLCLLFRDVPRQKTDLPVIAADH